MAAAIFELVLENGARVGVQANQRGGLKLFNLSDRAITVLAPLVGGGTTVRVEKGEMAGIPKDGEHVYVRSTEDDTVRSGG